MFACYRFAAKLRAFKPLLDACRDSVTAALHVAHPDKGTDVAIDGSDLPAYANGQPFVSKNGPERERYSDPDASWGHRSAVSTRKGRRGTTATRSTRRVCVTDFRGVDRGDGQGCRDDVCARPHRLGSRSGFAAKAIMDKGYDNGPIHDGCMDPAVCPVTPLRLTPAVVRAITGRRAVSTASGCSPGADYTRKATKWRCPTGECAPASVWVKADRLHRLIPRETARSAKLYKCRGAIEGEFGRLKHEWAMLPLRVRGIERVALHAELTILAKLRCARARARAVRLAT